MIFLTVFIGWKNKEIIFLTVFIGLTKKYDISNSFHGGKQRYDKN